MHQTLHHQVILDARALIQHPAHWTRRVLASTSNGHPVMWYAEDACRWCALGAINRAAYDLFGDRQRAEEIADEVIADFFPPSLSWINDKQGHAAILKLFDEALTRSPNERVALPGKEEEAHGETRTPITVL
jgi:hypothetical protein